mmetsp:Transcript_14600/g.29402  ORF Transcript_14600/g.29402 Transcript_14600/m.29402 type:complete len:223 (-) Transcript_14600:1536-2204(-)
MICSPLDRRPAPKLFFFSSLSARFLALTSDFSLFIRLSPSVCACAYRLPPPAGWMACWLKGNKQKRDRSRVAQRATKRRSLVFMQFSKKDSRMYKQIDGAPNLLLKRYEIFFAKKFAPIFLPVFCSSTSNLRPRRLQKLFCNLFFFCTNLHSMSGAPPSFHLVCSHSHRPLEGSVEYFRQCGVGVNHEGQLPHSCARCDCVCAFLNEVCSMEADDVHPQNFF